MIPHDINPHRNTISDLIHCLSCWEPNAKPIGNINAIDALNALKLAEITIFLYQNNINNGCQSSSCLVKKHNGQTTNGPCSCFNHLHKDHQLKLKKEWSILTKGLSHGCN